MNPYAERLKRMLADKTGIPAAEITLGTRLAADLKIDGDQAVRVMEEYSRIFQVDVEDLFQHWDHYFTKRGITMTNVVVLLFLTLIADAAILLGLPAAPRWLALAVDVALLIAWGCWIAFSPGSQRNERHQEITVNDLLNAIPDKRLRLK